MDTRTEMERQAGPNLSASDGPTAAGHGEQPEARARALHATARKNADAQTAPRVSVDPMRATDRYQLALPIDLLR